jgi:hypothetical protein
MPAKLPALRVEQPADVGEVDLGNLVGEGDPSPRSLGAC